MEQDEPGNGEHSPGPLSDHSDGGDKTHKPISGEENSLDDDLGDKQEPPPTGRWIATSSYDIYMVDTPKENNGEQRKDATEDNPLEKQTKHQCQRRRSKACHSKNSNNGTRKNNTPKDSKDNDDPVDPAMEQDEPRDGKHSLGTLFDHIDAEDKTYKPVSRKENSLDEDARIIPEKHLKQEHLHKRLIATARSLKKRKQLAQEWNLLLQRGEIFLGHSQRKGIHHRLARHM